MPAIVVELPRPLRRFSGGNAEVRVDAEDVAGVLASLARRHPDMARGVFDDDGAPRRFVRLYLNQVDVATLDRLRTRVAEGDRLEIVVAMAGG